MRLIPTAINITRSSLSFYSKSVSPLISKVYLPVKKLGYLAGTDLGILSSVLFKNGGTIAQRIMGAEHSFIESQGVKVFGNGELMRNTTVFLDDLRNSDGPAFNEAISRATRSLMRIEKIDQFEMRMIYRTLSRYLDNEALGRPISSINKEAKYDIIKILRRFGNEVRTLATFGKKEEVERQIGLMIKKTELASIQPDNGNVHYYDDLARSSIYATLGHEAGHPMFQSNKVKWENFPPLTPYGKTKKEEDFCENFSFYLNGYPIYWLLSKVSDKWAERFDIMRRLAAPKSLMPNSAALLFARARAIDMLLDANMDRIEKKLNAVLDSLGPTKRNNSPTAFNENQKKLLFRSSLDNHRKALASIAKAGGFEVPLTLKHNGRMLEEYGVGPLTASLVELLGEIPKDLVKCLDNGEGNLFNIFLDPSSRDPLIKTVTPYNIRTIHKDSFQNPILEEVMHTDMWDSEARPLSDVQIESSLEASRVTPEKRAKYYKDFEADFGVTLVGSENRAFSGTQMVAMRRALKGVPKAFLRGLKLVRTHSEASDKRDNKFTPGEIRVDDHLMSLLDLPKAFIRQFADQLAKHIAYGLMKKKDKKFALFTASGGFKRTERRALKEALRLGFGMPEGLLYESDADDNHFLTTGRPTPTEDLKDFIYFSAALPELLNEIAERNPKIAERLELFRAMVD